MQVLHVISSLDPKAGGVSQAVRTIIKGLACLNVNNEVACIDEEKKDFLRFEPFQIYAFGPGKSPWQYSSKLFRWLRNNLANYDVVIVHGLWQYPTYATYQAWKKLGNFGPKLFVMPHGMLDPYFQNAKGRKFKALRNKMLWMLSERNIINDSNGILFTCETERLLARQPFKPYHPRNDSVVGLGVELPPPYHARMQKAFEQKLGLQVSSYLLFISRIHEKKGVDLLIKAYLSLKETHPSLPNLVIAGPGLDTAYGKVIQELASAANEIVLTGMLTGDAKWGAFYGCNAFVLPSHQENFGIAVVEAMACGKAVLLSDQVNIYREVLEGKAGLVEKDTEEGAFQLIKRWVNMTHFGQEEMSLNALSVFQKHFTEEKASNRLYLAFK